jgi:hypothetical protein
MKTLVILFSSSSSCVHVLRAKYSRFLFKRQKIILLVKRVERHYAKLILVANISETRYTSTFCILAERCNGKENKKGKKIFSHVEQNLRKMNN